MPPHVLPMQSMSRPQQESKAIEAKHISASATTEAFVQQSDGTWQFAGYVHVPNPLYHDTMQVCPPTMRFAQSANGEYRIVENDDDIAQDGMNKDHDDDVDDTKHNDNHDDVNDNVDADNVDENVDENDNVTQVENTTLCDTTDDETVITLSTAVVTVASQGPLRMTRRM